MVKRTTGTESAAAGSGSTLFVGLVGLVWLAATGYASHAVVAGTLGDAVAALPSMVATTLVASASLGLVAGRRSRAGRRLRVGPALGALLGLAVAAGIRFAYDGEVAVMVLAVAAGICGGILAALPTPVLKAGLWGSSWVFLAGVVFGVGQSYVDGLTSRFALAVSVLTGLAAATCALRLRATGLRVLWYPVAGALPGLVLLAAHAPTRIDGFPVGSPALVELADRARLDHALVVLGVGGLAALLAGALRSLARGPARPGPVSVDTRPETLARIGLQAGARYGFALAGGHAVRAAGFLNRPTQDVDLFTVWERRDDFETGVRAIAEAYLAAGLRVESERRHDTFIRLTVGDGRQAVTVDLSVDLRANEPVQTPIGPVLHPDDVVANKMRALYERTHAIDFIDIDAVLRSGRYDWSALVRLARRADITFDAAVLAEALARVEQLPDDDFARYGVVGGELAGLRDRFAQWRAALLDTAASRPGDRVGDGSVA